MKSKNVVSKNLPSTSGKLSPPRLARVLMRERLFAELEQHADLPGMWITGSPGIGKTTLVASYLEAHAMPFIWLQLDVGDADPASFVHFLQAASKRLASRRRLRLPLPSADDLRDIPGFIRRCFRGLASAFDQPWVLVLDNVQELGAAPQLHTGLAAALSEWPQHARLITISREPPGPAYARALASQQLASLEASALHFDESETEQLVRLHDKNWSASTLCNATGGWAAAMILMLAARTDLTSGLTVEMKSLTGSQTDAETRAATQPTSGDILCKGVTRDRLFNFFASEVMEKMSTADAAALMHIAFLPSATTTMAVTISGYSRAAELLAEMSRNSLFTECRASTPATYTFHALFGEFLRARAADKLDVEALSCVHIHAAQLLAAHGQVDGAITRLIQAAAWDDALPLLLKHAARFVAQGRTATVRDWIMALPDNPRSDPQIEYWLGYCKLAGNPAIALQHFERAQRGFVAAGDMRWSLYTAAAAADAISFLGANLDALEPWMPVIVSHTADYLMQRDADTDLRVLPGLLAVFVHRETAHPLTAPLVDLAEKIFGQASGASQSILLSNLAYYLLWTGQTVRLDRIIIKIDRLCAASDAAPATLMRWYGVSVMMRSLLGRADEALDYASRALTLTEKEARHMRAKAHLLMVLAALTARNAELARTHLTEAAALLDPGNPIDTTTYEFQRAMLMLLEGDWSSAVTLMRAAVISGRISGWPLREHIALLGHALAATQIGAFDEAQTALSAAQAHRFHAVCRWHHWIAALIEANLAERRGDQAHCLDALTRAFAVAQEYGYDFGPLPYCCGDMMSRLMSIALEHDIGTAFAQRLIRRYTLPAPVGTGKHWPWPIRIYTLGRFWIEYDVAPTKASRKESRKPLDLLKLIVAFGGNDVSVPRLCAALWPDVEGDAARNSFDNSLHRLRKLLGNDSHVQLKGGGVSLNVTTCWTDLGALDACLNEADHIAPEIASTQVLALAERALSLFAGEFLAGEEDLPDVLATRTHIQAKFFRQMGTLGAKLEATGAQDAAARIYERAIEQQPLSEDMVRRLITCRLALGQQAEAYAAYRRCRQQLSILLGIRPSPETDALVAQLRNFQNTIS